MTKSLLTERSYIARVQWISTRGQYASTYVEAIGIVTFSINPEHQVWGEDELPIRRAKVVLSDLRLMDSGWRAFRARYFRPEDEDISLSNETAEGNKS